MARNPEAARWKPGPKEKVQVEISAKTHKALRDYCTDVGSQVRSELDSLIVFAIEERRKTQA